MTQFVIAALNSGIAVNSSGNIYLADSSGIQEWSPVNNSVTTVVY